MASPRKQTSGETTVARDGRFSYEGLDRVIHEKARLGVLTSLAGMPEGLTFNELKRLCELTDGNLNRHLAFLTEAGFVEQVRETGTGRPQTICKLTSAGRKKFQGYLDELQRVIADARNRMQVASSSSRTKLRTSNS